jgi:ribosome-binding protein aMBF1 (putative translation factor)
VELINHLIIVLIALDDKLTFEPVDNSGIIYNMKRQLLVQFGRRLRTERLRRNFSQEHLGELAKIHRSYIGMIERAEKNITLINIEKLSKALHVHRKNLVDF